MTSLLGRHLGRYHIQEEIGRGGMARVYRAYDPQLQRQIALKVLAPQLALDTEYIQRFQREAIIAANLHHPNIVTIYDVSEIEGLHFIAMEYIRGRSLHAIINERGALGLPNAVAIISAVGSALDFAHRQGAIHRDVKPHNIMINISGRVLLADFGIAQMPETRGDRLTRTGIFIGTPEYISPEQASARHVDGRSDLYSLGITAYELITGTVPFSGATPQLMIAHLQSAPPPLATLDPQQPPELDSVLARALAKNPDTRYQTGAAFAEALRQVARKYGLQESDATQLAALALPLPSPAGQVTTRVPTDETARQPAQAAPASPGGVPPVAPAPVIQAPEVRQDVDNQPTMVPPAQMGTANQPRSSANRWALWVVLSLLLALGLGALIVQGSNRPTPVEPTQTSAPIPTLPTSTSRPSSTPRPSPSPVPPTSTVVVPTEAPTEAPTEQPTDVPPTRRPTRQPTAVPQPTNTELPSPTPEPTATVTAEPPTATPTATPVPPTATPTPTEVYPPPGPTRMPTIEVPTPVATLPSPTATASFTATLTATSTATPTTIPPTETFTPSPTLDATATNTLEPTNTVQVTDTPTP